MSVLIKGMKMPKHCIDCPLKNDEDDCLVQELQNWKDWDSMKAGCPLVEVPTPHGRLVDADDLMHIYARFQFSSDMQDAMEILDNKPTVIEAEDE